MGAHTRLPFLEKYFRKREVTARERKSEGEQSLLPFVVVASSVVELKVEENRVGIVCSDKPLGMQVVKI